MRTRPSTPTEVDAFVASLVHPHKPEILALRAIVLKAHPSIREGIKWNSLSFHTSEYFATVHLRAKDGVQLILHLGAKKRDGSARLAIADPQGLLEWLAPDRASVKFRDAREVAEKQKAFTAVIRQWVAHV